MWDYLFQFLHYDLELHFCGITMNSGCKRHTVFVFPVKEVFLEKKHVHLFQAGVLQSSLEVDLDHYKLSCSWRCHSPPNLPAALQYKKVTKINMVDVLYNTSLSKRCNQPKFSIVTNKISRWNEADFIHFHSASFETKKEKKNISNLTHQGSHVKYVWPFCYNQALQD